MSKCFKDMNTAYERLDSIIQDGKKYIKKDEVPKKKKQRSASRSTQTKQARAAKQAKSTKQAKPTKQKSAACSSFNNSVRKTSCTQMALKTQLTVSDRYFTGNVPRREPLIGQFLYYSGLISWDTLNHAIVWQRRQLPIIGTIAHDWGFLSAEEIQSILKERSYKDYFGEYARRNGYITNFQHLAIVGKQRKMQPPIGRYFTQQGILGNYDIKRMAEILKTLHTNVINGGRR